MCVFLSFSHHTWCACDSNLGPQDSRRCRQIHWATAATLVNDFLLSNFNFCDSEWWLHHFEFCQIAGHLHVRFRPTKTRCFFCFLDFSMMWLVLPRAKRWGKCNKKFFYILKMRQPRYDLSQRAWICVPSMTKNIETVAKTSNKLAHITSGPILWNDVIGFDTSDQLLATAFLLKMEGCDWLV